MSNKSSFFPIECPSCHTLSAPNEQFCSKCGFNLKQLRQQLAEKREIDQFIEKQWIRHTVGVKNSDPESISEIPAEYLERSRMSPFHFRFVAYVLDNFFVWTIAFFITVWIIPEGQELEYFIPILIMVKMVIGLIYFTILETKWRKQTIGMLLVRIVLIDVYTNSPPADVRVLILCMIKAFEPFLLVDLIVGKYFSDNFRARIQMPITDLQWANMVRYSQKITRVCVVRQSP